MSLHRSALPLLLLAAPLVFAVSLFLRAHPTVVRSVYPPPASLPAASAAAPAAAHAAAAQGPVTLTANAPLYGFPALSGSIRCFNVQVAGGALNTINWSVPAGGAVFLPITGGTAPKVDGGIPMQCIRITAPPGHLTIVGKTVSSTQVVTIHAQSVDDPTKTVDTPFYIAANTTRVRIVGAAYQQVFLKQEANITADVQGNTDQSGTWSIVAAPAGASPTLADQDKRTVTLHAATTGRYTLKYTTAADPAQSGTAIVFMTPTPAPAFAVTPNKTRLIPCEIDPAFTGAVFEIGPGQKYPDFVATPSADTIKPGTMYRFHNADTTGSAPTVLHNYLQVVNSGTAVQPIYLCGVPDSAGNLPILDGDHATGQAGIAQGGACYQSTPVCLNAGGYSKGHPTGPYQAEPVGPNYVTVASLHIRNTRGTLFPPGAKSGEETKYQGAAGCIFVQSGTQIDLVGLDLENCANGIYTTENENNGFSATTIAISIRYNHIHKFGNENSGTEHALYFQTFFGMVEGSLIDEPLVPGKVGSCIKWRGIDGIFRYNSCPAGVGRDFDGVGVQDDSSYVDLTRYIDHGNFAAKDATPDIIAGLNETLYNGDWFYGNIIHQASGEAFHYRDDHDSLMAERTGQFYVYNNTVDTALNIFGVGDAQNGGSHFLDPVLHATNNIFWNTGVVVINYAFGITDSVTNLYKTGSLYIPAEPIKISSWYITPAGQLVVNGKNSLVNDNASGVTFAGLTGPSAECLNGKVFAVQYGGSGNFQGPSKCPPHAIEGAPRKESAATATPRILGGFPNDGSSHGWSNQCYYACPWKLTVPIDDHQYGLSPANFRTTPTQPYNPTTFTALGSAINAGQPLTGPAALLPVRYQYNPVTFAVEPRLSAQTIGARDPAR